MVVKGEVLNNFPRFVGILIAEFAADGAVNLALKIKGDMIIENLDLKPTIDAMVREFLESIVWSVVGIKRLLDDLGVTATNLMMLVYKLPLLVFRVNVAGSYNCSRIKIAERVSTVRREWIKTEERIKIDWRSRILT
ncbi:hypothetical protein Tco_0532286 [Tanacetum coccineum]